jgi:hypothetical protein
MWSCVSDGGVRRVRQYARRVSTARLKSRRAVPTRRTPRPAVPTPAAVRRWAPDGTGLLASGAAMAFRFELPRVNTLPTAMNHAAAAAERRRGARGLVRPHLAVVYDEPGGAIDDLDAESVRAPAAG